MCIVNIKGMKFIFYLGQKPIHHFPTLVCTEAVSTFVEKMILSKNVNNKKCDPKLVFFDEKKMRKIRMIFDREN